MFVPERISYSLRYTNKYVLPPYNSKRYGYRSFNYMGVKLWNSLTNELRNSSSLDVFKTKMNQWLENLSSSNAFV